MKYETIIIEEDELNILKRIMSMSRYLNDKSYKASISHLYAELEKVKVVNEEDMPKDVIRFNSIVTFETPFSKNQSYQIVTPEKSDIKNNKISVLAPMGLALFGYAKGDELTWEFPSGENTIKITDVKQP
ncbi:GreA/GreB family elongation factor [Psychroflexus halocasei]|uniref:Regulator of nucleoside diphosphate kinase n=1 Tax=Psychroflexus halocasei TaxID=908615 RepID=A0A1H4BQ27_9FLAO|nr:GreA/GreB family elongation factor [Psychroflexus halocasei]SEA50265.1 regulator of nucleoside diphosphate kinase [Psychroflexus halocasei]